MERTLVLDSGAVSGLARQEAPARLALESTLARDFVPTIPTAVIVESTTGRARDAATNRVIHACEIADLDESLARAAGALRAHVRDAEVVDAIVVATADLHPGSIVLTGDPKDLRRLAAVRGRTTVVAI